MKIEITEILLKRLAIRISAAAVEILRDELRQRTEQQLLAELRSSDLNGSERIAAYLERTPIVQRTVEGSEMVVVTNEYLYRHLAIPSDKMKAIRAKLMEDPLVQVHFTGGGAISIYYKRTGAVPTGGVAPHQ